MTNADNLNSKELNNLSISALVRLLAISLSAVILLAIPYSYILYWMPFPYLNFIFTLIFGSLVGVFVGMAAVMGEIYPGKLLKGFAFLIGLLATYFAWVFSITAMFGWGSITFNPLKIASVIGELGGTIIYLKWAVEAFVIIFLSVLAADSAYR